MVINTVEWPGMENIFPLTKRPFLGPTMIEPTKAAAPPTTCTQQLPA